MSLINLFVAARNSYSDWRRRQKAYGELLALDDRSLADIGIHRSQIPAIVAGREPAGSTAVAGAKSASDLAFGHTRFAGGHR